MLVLMLKSKLEQWTNWVAALALGPSLAGVARLADLSTDADMCLLLRVEVPRSAYPVVRRGLSLA